MYFIHHSINPLISSVLQTSPTSAHPPLQLRLVAPEEPGFILQKLPVHNMKEVWGILEVSHPHAFFEYRIDFHQVVREQCWMNGILMGCQWMPEGFEDDRDVLPEETAATEEELQAVLDGLFPVDFQNCLCLYRPGNLSPRKIPVNVTLPSHNITTDALFQTPDIDGISLSPTQPRRPRIVMTSPERPPMSGLVEIAVTYDESKPRGIAVEIDGAMGFDFEADVLEEICRRGGTLGLPGRVWSKGSL